MKLTIIGGGGVRSLFLAKSVASQAEALGIDRLVLMDTNPTKLKIYGGLARDTANLLEPSLRVELTGDANEALAGADAVITTIRAGGDELRVEDEKIVEELDLLPQETTGACGFAFAMRSIPALVRYCELTRKTAKKGAPIFNFTNPAGLVTQALQDRGYESALGICDAPTSLFGQIAKMENVPSAAVDAECFGLNHLSWFRSIRIQGEDRTQRLLHDPRLYCETDMKFFEPTLVQPYGALFNEYLYYYYYREQAVANIRRAGTTRGRQIMEINRAMTAAFQKSAAQSLEDRLAIFETYYGQRENAYMAAETGKKRNQEYRLDLNAAEDGGYAGVALRYLRIRQTGKPGRMILSIRNRGAIPFLEADDVAELSCTIDPDGTVRPDRLIEPLYPVAEELIRRMKLYERCAASAILNRDRALARDALQLHPLIASYSLASRLVDRFWEKYERFLEE